jgi:hypothetical protein
MAFLALLFGIEDSLRSGSKHRIAVRTVGGPRRSPRHTLLKDALRGAASSLLSWSAATSLHSAIAVAPCRFF